MSCGARSERPRFGTGTGTRQARCTLAGRRDLRRPDARRHRGRRVRRSRTGAPAQAMAAGRSKQDAGASASPAPAARASRRVVDELLLRFLHAFPQMRIAVLAVDPTRRRSRRRVARRSHPHEFAALQARVHALDGHAPPARGDERRAEGLHRVSARARVTTSSSSRRPASASPIRKSSISSISRCT